MKHIRLTALTALSLTAAAVFLGAGSVGAEPASGATGNQLQAIEPAPEYHRLQHATGFAWTCALHDKISYDCYHLDP